MTPPCISTMQALAGFMAGHDGCKRQTYAKYCWAHPRTAENTIRTRPKKQGYRIFEPYKMLRTERLAPEHFNRYQTGISISKTGWLITHNYRGHTWAFQKFVSRSILSWHYSRGRGMANNSFAATFFINKESLDPIPLMAKVNSKFFI